MKYTLKIQFADGSEVSSEPFELASQPENVNIEPVKKELPKMWSELGLIEGWYVDDKYSGIGRTMNLPSDRQNRNVYASYQSAQSALAYAQLTQLMKVYNGDWEPDWNDENQLKYCILRRDNCIVPFFTASTMVFLAFKTAGLREEFLLNFPDLIKTFYQIQEG